VNRPENKPRKQAQKTSPENKPRKPAQKTGPENKSAQSAVSPATKQRTIAEILGEVRGKIYKRPFFNGFAVG